MCHDGIISKSDITDMGDILLGNASGRDSDDQIIVYSVGGMPVEDVAWCKVCFDNAVNMVLGTKLYLWNLPDMC